MRYRSNRATWEGPNQSPGRLPWVTAYSIMRWMENGWRLEEESPNHDRIYTGNHTHMNLSTCIPQVLNFTTYNQEYRCTPAIIYTFVHNIMYMHVYICTSTSIIASLKYNCVSCLLYNRYYNDVV